MAKLRYLSPFGFLALVPAGAILGGGWTFLAAAATPAMLALFDCLCGEEATGTVIGGVDASRWFPRLFLIFQLAVTGWVAARVATHPSGLIEVVGLTLSTGVVSGVFGFVAAHELIHSRERRDRALGLMFLASMFYMHFRIAHLYGHHRRAATFADPATARLGEGLYTFLRRSIVGQFREAWAIERRCRRNRMSRYLAIEGGLFLVVTIFSWRAMLFLAALAAIAVVLLESFNYIAHYGLVRRPGERLGPQHSWNSDRRMNNSALLNMGRHSDHHRRATTSYDTLQPVAKSATLPSGYAAALLSALFPPLWRRIMDPRAHAMMGSA